MTMTLNEYMSRANPPYTQEEVARDIGCSKSTICRVLSGKGCSRRVAHQLEKWSRGDVTAADVLMSQRLEQPRGERSAA